MRNLSGKVVIVSGAASGIGRATADRVVDDGGIAVGLDVAVDASDNAGARWTTHAVDVRDEEAVADAVRDAAREHGRIDGVVTAAGVAGGGPVHLLPREEWDRVIGVNLTGTFLLCKHVIAQLLTQERRDGERGSIVTISSIEGVEGTAGGSSYNASKGGVVLLTKNLAIDYGPSGIRANAICPGFVDTPMTRDVFGMPGMEGPRDGIVAEHALRRFATPEEIAAVAAFLLSADASFVSGQAIPVDGGYTAGRDHGVTALLGLPE